MQWDLQASVVVSASGPAFAGALTFGLPAQAFAATLPVASTGPPSKHAALLAPSGPAFAGLPSAAT